jgi:hypothetical protein
MYWMKEGWVIRWPDGSRTVADTPEALIRAIGQLQWEPIDELRTRQRLSDRAWVWSKTAIDETLPAREFVQQLAEADMFVIEQES